MLRLNFKIFTATIHFHSARAVHSKISSSRIEEHQAEIMRKGLPRKKPIPGVKHIVVVASGKGGVGKSTTAVNLAVALKEVNPDKEVGLLDTDVFGPSVPLMMNLNETPLLTEDNLMVPLVNYNIKCHVGNPVCSMSMGFLIDEASPVVWRGLMVMSALSKLLYQVSWGAVDYLVVDTPPGTGDTQLSLVQNLPLSGAVLVTTPQAAALQVTRRGAALFRKLGVPVLGVVGNMSCVACPKCSHTSQLFGSGTQQLATQLVLAEVPLHPSISAGGDSGKPVVTSAPNSPQALAYKSLGKKISTALISLSNGADT
ncbi:iron-sulfur cluster transfer protein NUBPL isoform X2 [Bacillus rossius redtenbacheri]|uniref:iron-sulfur cluster transfer protein NUBPL isoform X2 n=1 Tax=Bacillus rossius redtenbacheri TaxID=93214 RepID=UPI002FDEB9F9